MIQSWSKVGFFISYLAQGDSILSKHTEFRIGKLIAYAIIPEICLVIWEALQPIFLPSMD